MYLLGCKRDSELRLTVIAGILHADCPRRQCRSGAKYGSLNCRIRPVDVRHREHSTCSSFGPNRPQMDHDLGLCLPKRMSLRTIHLYQNEMLTT